MTAPTPATPALASPTAAMRDRTGFDTSDPLFRRLVAGIFYSRQLVFTYYYLLFFTLLLLIFVNLGIGLRRWFRLKREAALARRNHQRRHHSHGNVQHLLSAPKTDDRSITRSSSCSSSGASSTTLYDSAHASENTPLLKVDVQLDRRNAATRARHALAAWLIYQPKPLPFFNRTMPTNGVSSFIFVYFLINVFYLLYNIEFSVEMLFVLAGRAAVLFVTNLPLLYLLSAKTQPLQSLTSYSYAGLNIFHRRLGEWMCLLALIHGGLMFVVWATILRPKDYSFARFIGDRVTILGLCTLTCYQLIFATSLSTIRRLGYEFFLACHIGLQAGALAFLYFHHTQSRPYVLVCVGIWLADRVIYRILARTRSFDATFSVKEDGQTIGVDVEVAMKRRNFLQAILGFGTIRAGWQALDHIFLTVPALGLGHALQSHPFSIASAPPSAQQAHAHLGLLIRARNGFSKTLLNYALRNPKASVRIDGSYGSHEALGMLQSSGVRVLVAGGSGIAVTWPLVNALLQYEVQQGSNDVEVAAEPAARKPIVFVWIVHDAEQYSWIEESQLAWLKGVAGVQVVLPPPTSVGGRPNLTELLGEWTSSNENTKAEVGVLCSGPDEMARDVRNGCSELVKSGKQITVEVEKYGW